MRIGGGPSETVLNPVVAAVVLAAIVLMWTLRRRFVIVPFLAAAILIPMDQVLVVGSLHFQMIRLLILSGWMRMFVIAKPSGMPLLSGGWTPIDQVFGVGAAFVAINGVFLLGGVSAIPNQAGTLYTTLGCYVLLRFFIRDLKDVEIALSTFAYLAAVIAVVMIVEQATGRNPYSMLGGFRAAATGTLMERDNRFRAMACFSHPILAGTFGAALFPLFLGLWLRGKRFRLTAITGVCASTIITLAADSSTPLLAFASVVAGMLLWTLRNKMQLIRRSIVVVLVGLHLYMKAPVWALIARADVISGSSSYHRYQLVDQCIRHFGDWWLIGTTQNAEWGWDMWDLANQYVSTAESSGLIPLVCFVASIMYVFRAVGMARRRAAATRREQWFVWTLGVGMLAHIIAFFGITYFDQTQVIWYAFLAIVIVATARESRYRAPVFSARKQRATSVGGLQEGGLTRI